MSDNTSSIEKGTSPTNPGSPVNQNNSPQQPIIYTINNSLYTKAQQQNEPSQKPKEKLICACCNKKIPEYLLQDDQVFYQKAYSYSFTKNHALRIEEVGESSSTLPKRPNAALLKFNERNELVPVDSLTNTSEKVVKDNVEEKTTELSASSDWNYSESSDAEEMKRVSAVIVSSEVQIPENRENQYSVDEAVVTRAAYLEALKQIEELKVASANLKNTKNESKAEESAGSNTPKNTPKKSKNNKKFKIDVQNRFNSLNDN